MLKQDMREEKCLPQEQILEEKLPECPFYKKFKQYAVICEGPEDQQTTQVNFASARQRKEYLDRFCNCMNFENCVIAKALYAKYE